jgi:cell division protein FtsB
MSMVIGAGFGGRFRRSGTRSLVAVPAAETAGDTTALDRETKGGGAPGAPGAPDDGQGGPPDPRGPLGRMPVAGLSRRSLGFVIGVLVVAWIVFVFARAVADSAASADEVELLRRQTAIAAAKLEATERELELIQSPDYLALQARGYGYGRPGEQVFSLLSDAPAPRPITPLGAEPGTTGRPAPLDDWLDLLFGP